MTALPKAPQATNPSENSAPVEPAQLIRVVGGLPKGASWQCERRIDFTLCESSTEVGARLLVYVGLFPDLSHLGPPLQDGVFAGQRVKWHGSKRRVAQLSRVREAVLDYGDRPAKRVHVVVAARTTEELERIISGLEGARIEPKLAQ